MSTTTTITISAAEKEWLPPLEAIVSKFGNDTDYSIGEFEFTDDEPDDEPPVQTVSSGGSWTKSFGYTRKWSTDGLEGFAVALTLAFPGIYVEVDEDWNDRDADEPGRTRRIYTAGRVSRVFETRLVEVQLSEKGEVIV